MDKPQGPTVYHSIAIELFLNEIKKEKKIFVYLELKFNWVFCILSCNPEEEGRKEGRGRLGGNVIWIRLPQDPAIRAFVHLTSDLPQKHLSII